MIGINKNQAKALYLSLRIQYLSNRPMAKSEESTMWQTWHNLNSLGWKWCKIKDHQLRENRTDYVH